MGGGEKPLRVPLVSRASRWAEPVMESIGTLGWEAVSELEIAQVKEVQVAQGETGRHWQTVLPYLGQSTSYPKPPFSDRSAPPILQVGKPRPQSR